jgi:hypothetical protein
MCREGRVLALAVLLANYGAARGQDTRQFVQQAVQTELKADEADHSAWLFYDADSKPNAKVKQWVAQTAHGDVDRVVVEYGRTLPAEEQRRKMDGFVHDKNAQAKQQKSGRHDDAQAEQMLKLLPVAFVWSKRGDEGGRTTLHFAPDPHFHPPSYEARVFAAMEGDMVVDDAQHRIASLKGRMTHSVKFGYGLFGELKAGGTFDVERRETGNGVWQITETHVHVEGRALLFKNISDVEDDVKSKFKRIAPNLSLADAEKLLMGQHT